MRTAESIKQLHEEMQHARERVLALTGIRENDLNNMIIDGGEEWLKLVTRHNARALQFLPRTREFWGFWRKTWHQMDLVFLAIDDHCRLNREMAIFYYYETHRITLDNQNVNNSRVFAHYHLLRSMITYMKP